MNDFTVVIPTFNRANLLDRTLNSLNEQKNISKFKVIISDNNCTDNTYEIVKKWRQKSEIFIIDYIKQNNTLSPVDNWSVLIDKIDTTYSKIVFDDDWLKPNAIETYLKIIKEQNADTVVSNIDIYMDDGSNNTKKNYFEVSQGWMNQDQVINYFLQLGKAINVSPSASLIKTSVLKEAFYFSLINNECSKKVIGNDLIMNYYSLFKSQSVYYIDETLAVCGAGKDSITISTEKRILFYCYLNSLLLLLNTFNIQLSKTQRNVMKRKIFIYKIRKIFIVKYRNLLINKYRS
jgi:glycosyltransferase involved in cell wall biosynthesis